MKERLVTREDGVQDLYPDYQDGQFVIEPHPTVAGRWAVYEKRKEKDGSWGRKDISRKEGFSSSDQAKEWVKHRPNLPINLLVEVEINGERQCVVRARPPVAPPAPAAAEPADALARKSG